MKKVGLKWSPSVPARRPDNLISSRARENGESGFKPSYENEPRENMYFIMSNEYMRIWFKDRTRYEIDTYSKLEVESGAKDMKRRIVQRYMYKKKDPSILPPIKMKRSVKSAPKVKQDKANA